MDPRSYKTTSLTRLLNILWKNVLWALTKRKWWLFGISMGLLKTNRKKLTVCVWMCAIIWVHLWEVHDLIFAKHLIKHLKICSCNGFLGVTCKAMGAHRATPQESLRSSYYRESPRLLIPLPRVTASNCLSLLWSRSYLNKVLLLKTIWKLLVSMTRCKHQSDMLLGNVY